MPLDVQSRGDVTETIRAAQPSPAPRPSPWSTGFVAALLLCFAAAAALRLHHLGSESVWLDEAFSIDAARGSLGYIIDQTSQDVHPPLYYVVLHYWIRVVGSTEAAARLLSVLFSLGIMGAAVAMALRLLDRRAALAVAALLAVSPFHVEFAQEARMYTLLTLLGTLSVYAFLEAFVLAAPRRRWVAAYVVITTLMLYTQIYSVFIVAAEVALVAIGAWTARDWFRRTVWTWLAASVVIVVLYLPWLATLYRQVTRVQGGFWIPERPWIAVLHPFLTYAGSLALVAILVPLTIWGGVRLARSASPTLPRGLSARTILIVWLAAPIVLPFTLSRLGSPIFLPKYTIPASVPFALLAAHGVARLPGLWLRVGLVALVAWWSVDPLGVYYRTPRKDGWRSAVAHLEAQAAPGDLVVIYRNFNQMPFDYYARRDDIQKVALYLEDPPVADEVAAAVDRVATDRRRVWLVTLTGEPATPLIADALDRSFVERAHTDEQRIEMFLFERR